MPQCTVSASASEGESSGYWQNRAEGSGAGQEHRGQARGSPSSSCRRRPASGLSACAPGAVRPWASHAGCRSPVPELLRAVHRSPQGNCFPSAGKRLPGAAAPGERGALSLSPALLRSTFQLFTIMGGGGGRTTKKVLWALKTAAKMTSLQSW